MFDLILFFIIQGFLFLAPSLGCFALGWIACDAVTKRKAKA